MTNLPSDILALGQGGNVMRVLAAYGAQRKAIVGPENVYDYSLGNPNVPPPASVNDTIREILAGPEGGSIHAYTSAQGDIANRQRLADSLNRRFGGSYSPNDLYFTVGAAASLTICFHALTVPGDEYVLLAPFFGEYSVFLQGAGGKIVICPPDLQTFQPDFDALAAAIGPNTKGLVINTPNNPSGAVYSRETIARMGQLLRDKSAEYGHPIYLISDEPYREIVFGDEPAPWVLDYYETTLVCYSYSKALALSGERIGYILVPPALADHDRVYAAICGAGRRLGFVNAPSLFQRVVSLCDGQTADIEVYRTNRDLLYNALTEMGFDCLEPQGTFYLLMRSPEPDANAFSEKAKEFDLLLVPTDTFSLPGHIRIAFCVTTEQIKRSLPAFQKLADAYGLGK